VRLIAVLGMVAVTTTAALVYGWRRGRLSRATLRHAAATMLEYAGLCALFLMLNVVLGAISVIVLRSTTRYFVSVYVINDLLLVLLSFLQALFLGPFLLSHPSPRD
jgi:hypothetical protein